MNKIKYVDKNKRTMGIKAFSASDIHKVNMIENLSETSISDRAGISVKKNGRIPVTNNIKVIIVKKCNHKLYREYNNCSQKDKSSLTTENNVKLRKLGINIDESIAGKTINNEHVSAEIGTSIKAKMSVNSHIAALNNDDNIKMQHNKGIIRTTNKKKESKSSKWKRIGIEREHKETYDEKVRKMSIRGVTTRENQSLMSKGNKMKIGGIGSPLSGSIEGDISSFKRSSQNKYFIHTMKKTTDKVGEKATKSIPGSEILGYFKTYKNDAKKDVGNIKNGIGKFSSCSSKSCEDGEKGTNCETQMKKAITVSKITMDRTSSTLKRAEHLGKIILRIATIEFAPIFPLIKLLGIFMLMFIILFTVITGTVSETISKSPIGIAINIAEKGIGGVMTMFSEEKETIDAIEAMKGDLNDLYTDFIKDNELENVKTAYNFTEESEYKYLGYTNLTQLDTLTTYKDVIALYLIIKYDRMCKDENSDAYKIEYTASDKELLTEAFTYINQCNNSSYSKVINGTSPQIERNLGSYSIKFCEDAGESAYTVYLPDIFTKTYKDLSGDGYKEITIDITCGIEMKPIQGQHIKVNKSITDKDKNVIYVMYSSDKNVQDVLYSSLFPDRVNYLPWNWNLKGNVNVSLSAGSKSIEVKNNKKMLTLRSYKSYSNYENDETYEWINSMQEDGKNSNTNINTDDLNINDTRAKNIVSDALSKIGTPYSQPLRNDGNHYDCSSFVYYIYKKAGINIGYGGVNTAAAEAQFCKEKNCVVYRGGDLDINTMKPGDLIFYSMNTNGRFMNISHVAMYCGNGKVCDASFSVGKVVYRKIYNKSQVVMIGRPLAISN